MEDNKFTNKSNIEYPLEEDFVDIKVLNNNTRLLDIKKANISDLEDVARESTPMAIENAIKNISNDVSQNLQNVAKESEPNIIENKIIELENKLTLIEEKEKLRDWLSSPNTIIKTTQLNNINDKIIVEITGSGYLAICLFNNLIHGTAGTQSYKVEIDDEIVFDTKVNFTNSWESGDGTSGKVSQIGIFNSSFYTYTENDDILGISMPILSYGIPYLIGSNLDRLKSLGSVKNTVSNTDGLIKTSKRYHAYYVPVGIKTENFLRFDKKLKISTYDTQGMIYTNSGAINCLCSYQLDE